MVRGTVSPPAAVVPLLVSIGGATPHTPQGLGVVPLITPRVDLYAIGGLTIGFVHFYVAIGLNFACQSPKITLGFWPAHTGTTH